MLSSNLAALRLVCLSVCHCFPLSSRAFASLAFKSVAVTQVDVFLINTTAAAAAAIECDLQKNKGLTEALS